MSSEKFQKVFKDNFEVLMKFFRKCQQFFISTFSMKKCPKSRRIWGMSRAAKIFWTFFEKFDGMRKVLCDLVIMFMIISGPLFATQSTIRAEYLASQTGTIFNNAI